MAKRNLRDRLKITAVLLEGKIDSSIDDFSSQRCGGTSAAEKSSKSEPFSSSISGAFIFRRSLIPFVLLLCTSCFSRPALMTRSDFDDIQTGSSINAIEMQMGKPYSVHNTKDGCQEYEYIERIDTGTSVVAENHYFLVVKEGKVVRKYVSRERPPAYDLIYQDQPNYPDESNLSPNP